MQANQQQSEAWNGPESVHYVDQADRYDRQLAPVTDALLAMSGISGDDSVLDVGCGCGAMALQAAQRARRVVGVDISGPLVEVAVDRARRSALTNTEFVVADAQTHRFDGEFDLVVSQFGLMFFDDPVAAFVNIRGCLSPRGRIVFTTWQRLGLNEWLAPVVRAVGRFTDVPDLGGLSSGGGMFALRDDVEIASLLGSAGFHAVEIEPSEPALVIGGGDELDESVEFLLDMGIVRGLLGRLDPDQRASAVESLRSELEQQHVDGVGIRSGAGIWLVSARGRS